MMAAIYAKYESGGVLLFAEMAKYDRAGKLDREIQKILRELGKKTAKNTREAMKLVYIECFEQAKKLVEAAANWRIPGIIKNECCRKP